METSTYIAIGLSIFLLVAGVILMFRNKSGNGTVLIFVGFVVFLTGSPLGERIKKIGLNTGGVEIELLKAPIKDSEASLEFAAKLTQAANEKGTSLTQSESVSLVNEVASKIKTMGFSPSFEWDKEQYEVGNVYEVNEKDEAKLIAKLPISGKQITTHIKLPDLVAKERTTIFGRAGEWVRCENPEKRTVDEPSIKETLRKLNLPLSDKRSFVINEVITCNPLSSHWDPGIGGGVGAKHGSVVIGYRALNIDVH